LKDIIMRSNQRRIAKLHAVPQRQEADAETSYRQALIAISKIAADPYRGAALEGLISARLKAERLQPDSDLGMRLRREAQCWGRYAGAV